jgi:integrase
MSLTAVLRRMKVAATAHGFRSTFRDWMSEHTEYSGEVAEMALSHAIGDKVEAAIAGATCLQSVSRPLARDSPRSRYWSHRDR